MKTMTLAETKAHLSAVVDQVQKGEDIVITRRGRPVARISAELPAQTGEARALVKELRAFVQAQTVSKGNSVTAMRAEDPY